MFSDDASHSPSHHQHLTDPFANVTDFDFPISRNKIDVLAQGTTSPHIDVNDIWKR